MRCRSGHISPNPSDKKSERQSDYDPRIAEAEGYSGWHSAHLLQINVRTDQHSAEVANTLIHEVLHAAYKVGDLSPGDPEERVVTVLANVLCEVWRDNPEFVRFMTDSLK